MKKFTQKLIAILLCVAMVGSFLPMGARAEGENAVYTLYPTPHSVVYDGGSFELSDINVQYGNGIDIYTKARLEETAELLGLSVTEAAAASDKTNVYVAIYGSGDTVESYILANYTVDTTLFAKTDANFVATRNGEIVVLGKDTDSCFYGLTTLYQIFGQLADTTLRNLTINDYADVVSRGFIEGYYGNPWSVEDRAALMTWGGYYKLNSYFYAPKDDPKHNSKWRELYTQDELETLVRPLAEAGNASKCRYVFALHPYMNNPIRYDTEEHYQEDLGIMKAKFEQVISVGVRQIAILADDAAVLSNKNNYTRTLNDMTAWLREMQQTYPDLKLTLPFVAPGFEYAGYGESYYRDFPENVQIVMTGGQVWGYVTQSFVDRFYNNVGRGPYMWINWPCTDNSKNHLIMGGYADWLYPGVSPDKIQGIVLNPMQQSEPSKVAIFGNACYSWNIWESREEADAAWEASFSCVNHKSVVPNAASEALKELSKHMINQAMTNGVVNLQESVEIRDELNALKSKLSSGTYTQAELDYLKAEFVKLQQAAVTFRAEGHQPLAEQIVYWLDCWDDTTLAAISYLDALSAIQKGEDSTVIWDHYATGQSAWESSRTHALWYIDHYEYAEAGVQHIVPFMNALHTYLSNYVLDIVDPSGGLSGGGSSGGGSTGGTLSLSAFEGNNPGYYSGSLNSVVDGNTSTSLWYNDYGRVGQYIGVDLGSNVMIGNVSFVQDNGDHFSDYTLQYSRDGVNYTNYKNYSEAVLNADLSADGIEARYIRFYNNASTNVWIKVYEIQVTEAASTRVITNDPDLASWQTRIGEDTAQVLTTGALTLSPNEYIGMDLRRIKDLATITVNDLGGLTLQVSPNMVDWVNVEAGEVTEDGRYVRLINLTDADVTTTLNTFTVTSLEYGAPKLHSSDIGINSSWGVAEDSRNNGAAFDGNVATTTEFGDFVTTGQYFIYDLGRERDIRKLEIYCSDSAVNYIRDAEMQISNDLQSWTTVLTIGDGVQNTGEDNVTCINSNAGYSQATSSYPNIVSIEGEIEAQTARYIRVIMTAPNTERAVLFNEIEINDGEYISVSNDPTFVTTAIEVQGYAPQHMTDGDLTTSWKPNTTEAGSMVYTFSSDLQANRINIVQKNLSNARVLLYAENDGQREWINMGTLDKTLVELTCANDLNLKLKIEWDAGSVPNITEIIRYTVEEVSDKSALNALIASVNELNAINYTAESWADLEVALAAAQDVARDVNATQADVDAAVTALQASIDALEDAPYFNITIAEMVGGTVTANKTQAHQGETITLTVQATAGYRLVSLKVNDIAIEGTSFTMPGRDVTITAEFEDVSPEAIEAAREAQAAAAAAQAAAEAAEAAAAEALAAAEEAEGNAEVDPENAAAARQHAEEAQAAAESAAESAAEAAAAAQEATAAAEVYDAAAAAAAAEDAKRAQEVAELYKQIAESKAELAVYLSQVRDDAGSAEEDRENAEAAELAAAKSYAQILLIQYAEDSAVQGETLDAALNAGIEAINAAETVEDVEAALAAAKAAIDALTEAPAQRFEDVPEGIYYYEPVLWAVENGITKGTSDTTFSPDRTVSRAEAVTFLWRAAGKPDSTIENPFADVAETDFYYEAVLWAVENGITKGVDATHFDPLSTASRGHVVTFLHRAMDKPEASAENPFDDVPEGIWFHDAVLWAVENGITKGVSSNYFDATSACNRAQMVTFLYRAYN